MRPASLLPAVLVAACATAPSPEPKTATESGAESGSGAESEIGTETGTGSATGSGVPSRFLSPDDSYAAVVRLLRALVDRGHADSGAGCVLTRRADATLMLTADLMPALQNPPEPPRRLGPLLRDHLTPIAVLSGWGVLGNGQGLSLVALTSVPPEAARAAVTGVFLTPDGAYLRYGQRDASPGADGPLGPEALVTRLLAVERGEPSTLFVTAEADVPVSDLWSLLRTLPGDRSVALATPLPPGTALPNPGRPSTPAPRCPDGLPPLAEGETPGDLDRHAVIAALPPLHRAGADCMARARGAAATGGTLTLALRVGPDGTVADACLLADDTRDAALGACLLEAARTLQFPAPSPPGPVDLHLPLSLIPTGLTIQRATCAL